MLDELFLAGRVLFCLVFIKSGWGHLTQTEGATQYAAYKNVPSPRNTVLGTGVAMLVASGAIILGIWMDLAALGLALFLILAALWMHRFWDESDEQAKQGEMNHFLKNVSLAGGALVIAAAADLAGYTITDGVF